ncbi:MAG: WXG100 family type VII secretion target [bacterium]
MSDAFRVDVTAVAGLIDAIGAFALTVSDVETEVDRRLDSLPVSWRGDASRAAGADRARWAAGVRQLQDGVGDLREAVRAAESNYAQALSLSRAGWGG